MAEDQGHLRSVSPGTSGPQNDQEVTGSGEAEVSEGIDAAQQSAGWGESQMGVLQGECPALAFIKLLEGSQEHGDDQASVAEVGGGAVGDSVRAEWDNLQGSQLAAILGDAPSEPPPQVVRRKGGSQPPVQVPSCPPLILMVTRIRWILWGLARGS